MSARQLGLIANDSKDGARELLDALVREFRRHPVQLHFDRRAGRLVGAEKCLAETELADICEMLIVLGGDGTILDVSHALGQKLRPLFGINIGTLGFLTTVGANEYARAVEAIVAGDYVLSERTRLKVELVRGGDVVHSGIVLNDAVASRGEISRLVRLTVRIGVVNPICPHVLTNRAVIVNDSTPISITPADASPDIVLTLDGRTSHRIESGDTIRIARDSQRLSLAMLPGVSFFDVLRQKLKWSGAAV